MLEYSDRVDDNWQLLSHDYLCVTNTRVFTILSQFHTFIHISGTQTSLKFDFLDFLGQVTQLFDCPGICTYFHLEKTKKSRCKEGRKKRKKVKLNIGNHFMRTFENAVNMIHFMKHKRMLCQMRIPHSHKIPTEASEHSETQHICFILEISI